MNTFPLVVENLILDYKNQMEKLDELKVIYISDGKYGCYRGIIDHTNNEEHRITYTDTGDIYKLNIYDEFFETEEDFLENYDGEGEWNEGEDIIIDSYNYTNISDFDCEYDYLFQGVFLNNNNKVDYYIITTGNYYKLLDIYV